MTRQGTQDKEQGRFNLLRPVRNGKQLTTIHCLTGRKDVIQVIHELNVCLSNNGLRLHKSLQEGYKQAHVGKASSTHKDCNNNDGMQHTLTWKVESMIQI